MKSLVGLSEDQVLQRLGQSGATVTLSGETLHTGPIAVSIFAGKKTLRGWNSKRMGKAAKGTFRLLLKGIPTGGPYRLTLQIEGKRIATVKRFFVGDVWILAGQSNMEGSGIIDRSVPMPRPHPLVRAFSMAREWRAAEDPLHVTQESPDECHNGGARFTPEAAEDHRKRTTRGFSPALPFALEMVAKTGIPQGLIATAHGGSPMRSWDPTSEGVNFYQSMLASVRATKQPVAGVLWYQGESDVNETDVPLYTARMTQLVAATRKDLKLPSLPWVIVQISRRFREATLQYHQWWNAIQEQQRQLPSQIKNMELVASVDLPLDDSIHIASSAMPLLGKRLALAAMHLVLKTPRTEPPPQLLKIHPVKGGETSIIRDIEFAHVGEGLVSLGEPTGFAVLNGAGENSHQIFRVTLHGSIARLHLATLCEDQKIAYGYGSSPYCNITDSRGFSLPAFTEQLSSPKTKTPFLTHWVVSDLFHSPLSLDRLKAPDFKRISHRIKEYVHPTVPGIVDEAASWRGKRGFAAFSSRICLSEPMRLGFLLGYDGPIRLWVDERPIFTDLNGTNPCLPDQQEVLVKLAAGEHEIKIVIDVGGDLTWGFFLRLDRKDPAKKGDPILPSLLV